MNNGQPYKTVVTSISLINKTITTYLRIEQHSCPNIDLVAMLRVQNNRSPQSIRKSIEDKSKKKCVLSFYSGRPANRAEPAGDFNAVNRAFVALYRDYNFIKTPIARFAFRVTRDVERFDNSKRNVECPCYYSERAVELFGCSKRSDF